MSKWVPLAVAIGLTGCAEFEEGSQQASLGGSLSETGISDGGDTTTGGGSADSKNDDSNSDSDTTTGGDDDDTGIDPTDDIPEPECGNGIIEEGELCDEGDENGLGYCKDNCSPNYCGDGYVGPGELCDEPGSKDCTDDCTLVTCGDGNVDPPEQCDDMNGNNSDACLSTCVFASCGDQYIWEGMEACDSDNVAGQTCLTQGFDGGTLVCRNDCTGFNTASCYACGDGQQNPGEECDMSSGVALCPDQGNVVCLPDCTEDFSNCWSCNDGEISGPEQCDDGVPFTQDCVSRGYDGGTLACTNGMCQWDESGCWECGDGEVNPPDEDCDGNDETCEDALGPEFSDTEMATCQNDCTFDTSACCLDNSADCSTSPYPCCSGNCNAGTCECLPNGSACNPEDDQCCGTCNDANDMCS